MQNTEYYIYILKILQIYKIFINYVICFKTYKNV